MSRTARNFVDVVLLHVTAFHKVLASEVSCTVRVSADFLLLAMIASIFTMICCVLVCDARPACILLCTTFPCNPTTIKLTTGRQAHSKLVGNSKCNHCMATVSVVHAQAGKLDSCCNHRLECPWQNLGPRNQTGLGSIGQVTAMTASTPTLCPVQLWEH